MPGYFWSLDDTLKNYIISHKLTEMFMHGAKTVCPLPMPKEFRPVTQPTRLEPDYMTPGYLEYFRYAAEQCKKLNMKMWLYDEGGWPSGSCLGRVVKQNPSLVRQMLIRQVLTPGKGNNISIPDDCLSAFLYQGDKKINRLTPGTTKPINIDNARIMIFSVSKTGTYPDLLNPESTKEFIKLTHEEYKKAVGDYFGNTIQMTFTDEAQATNPGWTNDIVDDFMSKYGYDLRNELPSIFEGDEEHDRQVRIDYFNWWSRRHADTYYGQIQEWCRRNNLLSGGHLNGEDATEYARRYGYGHPLRALRRMDVPGIDVIWRQLWIKGNNHHFPKYASTVSHQAGMPWSFTESFAVYGNGLTTSQMKWISDYQYVRGINLSVMGGYPISKKDWLQAGCRPLYGPGDPLWQYMDDYHRYLGRLGYILSLGKPDIKIALYYPVSDIWAGGSELNTVCTSNDELARILLENQCDFDFIDDDILESESTIIANGQLKVGPMLYEAVCVSRNQYMPEKTIKKLEEFIKSGGKVFWVDNSRETDKPKGSVTTTLSQLPSLLTPIASLETPNNKIRICKRSLSNSSIYFITNEDSCGTTCKIKFNEKLPVVQLDAETGKCWIPSKAKRTSGGWTIPLDMKFAGSCLFIFTNESLPAVSEPNLPGETLQTISTGWTFKKTRKYVIGDKEIEIHELPAGKEVGITLGDWRQMVGDTYSGDVEYMVSFKCTGTVKKKARVLDLGDVRYVCEASLNGQPLGKRLWQPFGYDIKGKLKKGNNILKITVTNTLANQYVYNTKALDKWTKNQLGPYHDKALTFEKESVSSGLFGPVTIK